VLLKSITVGILAHLFSIKPQKIEKNRDFMRFLVVSKETQETILHIYVCKTTKNNVSMRKIMETLHKNTFEKIFIKKICTRTKMQCFQGKLSENDADVADFE